MIEKPSYFLGISPYLHPNAVGHYLGVHTLYHEELDNQGIPNRYFGTKNYEISVSWIDPKIDFIPTKLINFDQIFKQIRMGYEVWKHTAPSGLNFVFEGNLNYWLILAIVSRLKSSSAHVTLIRSDLVFEELIQGKNPIARLYFKVCNFVGRDFSTLSTLSNELSLRLETTMDAKVNVIPTISSFRPVKSRGELESHFESRRKLVFAPYLSDVKTLLRIIENYPEVRPQITVSSWQSDEVMSEFTKYDIPTSNSHLSEVEYGNLLLDSDHVILLYLNSFHEFGSSSKVYDCARLGINVSVPANTAVEEQALSCANVFSFDGESDESIVQSILFPKFENHYDLRNIPDGRAAVSFLLSNYQDNSRKSSKLKLSLGILGILGIIAISLPVFTAKKIKSIIRRINNRI